MRETTTASAGTARPSTPTCTAPLPAALPGDDEDNSPLTVLATVKA
ncbi:hypothetical protein [Streptomyces sp. NPDC004685]